MEYIAMNSKCESRGLIDEQDFDLIRGKAINLNSEGYARVGSKKLHIMVLENTLGRMILDGKVVDHINRNRLDNRRCNLREATPLQNALNKERNSRKCFGSTYLKKRSKWQAQIKIEGRQTYLGVFDTEEEAQECYLKKAKELNRL